MACLTHLVTVGLRRPYWSLRNARVARRADLTSELDAQRTNGWWGACDSHDHPLTWLLAWTSQTHVLGCLILLSNDWVSALPAVLVGLTVELVLWPFSPADWQERLRQLAAREHDLDQQPDQQRAEQNADQAAEQLASSGVTALTIDSRDWQRGSTQGQLPTGESFMTGWIRYRLGPGQKTTTLTIGFSPPFTDIPSIDLDQEFDELAQTAAEVEATAIAEVEAEVEHVTPAGMRVVIKRSDAREAVSGQLLWHAATADEPSPSALAQRLP